MNRISARMPDGIWVLGEGETVEAALTMLNLSRKEWLRVSKLMTKLRRLERMTAHLPGPDSGGEAVVVPGPEPKTRRRKDARNGCR